MGPSRRSNTIGAPSKVRIMGGMFGLEPGPGREGSAPPFLKGGEALLVNARSALALLLDRLAPARIWLPSYLCESLLKGLERSAAKRIFYPVADTLCLAPPADWLDDVRPGDLVVLIDYFGFPFDPHCAERARRQGALVLEDACQALLSAEVGRAADFMLYSPRKFLGVPDGGILRLQGKNELPGNALEEPPASWWLRALEASLGRRAFDRYGGDRRWFTLFQETETQAPTGPYAMSQLAELLLRHGVDYEAVSRKRQENYRFLAERLGAMALFPQLPDTVVPLGFPIRLAERDRARGRLFEAEIYPAVHWPIAGVVPAEFRDSHRLAAEIMTLPCDQRYGREDMERLLEVLGGHGRIAALG